jgi:flagellin FlaB
MRRKLKGLIDALNRERHGITGLETAIILIAFVVVASVFAYTVLSAGVFASQKAQQAIYEGMEGAGSILKIKGTIVALGNTTTNDVDYVVFTVGGPLEGARIYVDFTNPTPGGNNTPASASTHVLTIGARTSNEVVHDLMWTATQKGRGNGDSILETGEKFEIIVDLRGLSTIVGAYERLTLTMIPSVGATVIIEKTMPAVINAVMILH